MGAGNALLVYATWGRVLDDRPFRVLAYMALVARDNDAEPWFGLGHEAIAELALGLRFPDDETGQKSVLRAVRRAITPLHACGAICTERKATYGKHGTHNVRYRLHLTGPCDHRPQDGERPMNNPVDNSRPQDGERPMADEAIGRSVVVHRTVSGRPQDGERPTKEYEEEEERKNLIEISSTRDVEGAHAPAREPPATNGHRPSWAGPIEKAARRAVDQETA